MKNTLLIISFIITGLISTTTTLVAQVNVNPPEVFTLEICDDNGDGIAVFDLTDNEPIILDGQNPNDFVFVYYLSSTDANAEINPIINPESFTNTVNDEEIYPRYENVNSGEFSITLFYLVVNDEPTPITPTPLEVCDDDNDGFAEFTLTNKDLEILGGEPGVSISYYETLLDADMGINPLISPYTNIIISTQIVYVRAEYTTPATGCYRLVSLELIVNATPNIPIDLDDLVACDSDQDEIVIFDLTIHEAQILNGENWDITYYESYQEAIEDTGAIATPSIYENLSNPQTIYVRVTIDISNPETCFDILDLELIVLPTPEINPVTDLVIFDENNDGMEIFDLNTKTPEILNGQNDVAVIFYETQQDAIENVNAIANPETYQNITNPQTIFTRLENIITGCYIVTSFIIFANPDGIINIPDSNFKYALVNTDCVDINDDGWLDDDADTNDDGEIQVSEAEAVIRMDVSSRNISSLEGIQSFVNLEELNCNNNSLTNLDITQNAKLVELVFAYNQLTNIDVSQNLDIKLLYATNNLLNSLDVTQNSALESIWCVENQLTSIDFTQNPILRRAWCDRNSFTSLDLSQNPMLDLITCTNNQLISLNLNNGNNTNMIKMFAQFNPNLICIQVDDVDFANSQDCDNDGWCKDDWASYSEDCNPEPIVDIPDANFKNALVNENVVDTNNDGQGDSDADTNDDGEIQLIEAQAVVFGLFVSNNNISDLDGIQSFSNLKILHCDNNNLSELDVTQNSFLENLRCDHNNITNLNVSQNLELFYLFCSDNLLTSLEVTQNPSIGGIYCNNNQLTNLDVSQNPNLGTLYCENNLLTELNITQNPMLWFVACYDNQLANINLSQIPNLARLRCYNNQLTSLDISQNPNFLLLWCYNNQLVELNLQNGNNTNIAYMKAESNPNLSCIQVDDVDYANNQGNWTKDNSAEYSEDCNPNPIVAYPPSDLEVCDVNNPGDGVELFDLTVTEPEILNGQDDIEVTFYETEQDAQDNVNVIANPSAYTNITNPQTIFTRLENLESSCYTVGDFVIVADPDLGVLQNLYQDLTIYPNPTQNILNLESNQQIERVKIYNLQGQLIKEGFSNSIDISQLTSGLYFVQVTVEGKTVTKKFIKE
mgnify:CR=1 FL=1